jgi:uncharacterized protein (UPF0276 family)
MAPTKPLIGARRRRGTSLMPLRKADRARAADAFLQAFHQHAGVHAEQAAQAWLDAVPGGLVGEVHLAGHSPDPVWGEALLIDSHDTPVSETVWALYDRLIARIGSRPTLVERDGDVPEFSVLLDEQARAAAALTAAEAVA